jgi:hypothetical protein
LDEAPGSRDIRVGEHRQSGGIGPDQGDHAMPDNDIREVGPQPDPMLQEGPASSPKKWAILAAVAVILALTVVGISHRGDQSAQVPSTATTGSVPKP